MVAAGIIAMASAASPRIDGARAFTNMPRSPEAEGHDSCARRRVKIVVPFLLGACSYDHTDINDQHPEPAASRHCLVEDEA